MFFISKFIFTLLFVVSLFFGTSVFAQTDLRGQINAQVEAGSGGVAIGDQTDPRLVVAGVIQVILQLIGAIFLVLIVIAGFWYVTASGDETKVENAKKLLSGAIIGLAIILISYGITRFVVSRILWSVAGV